MEGKRKDTGIKERKENKRKTLQNVKEKVNIEDKMVVKQLKKMGMKITAKLLLNIKSNRRNNKYRKFYEQTSR